MDSHVEVETQYSLDYSTADHGSGGCLLYRWADGGCSRGVSRAALLERQIIAFAPGDWRRATGTVLLFAVFVVLFESG